MSGELRTAIREILAEREHLHRDRAALDGRIAKLNTALELLGYSEDKTPTGRERRAPAPDSIEGVLRRWVATREVEVEFSLDDALAGMLALGWCTEAERPLDGVRPHIARLCRDGTIRRVRRGWYVVPDPIHDDDPLTTEDPADEED